MPINDYSIISHSYASLDNSGTALLAFKSIPTIIKKYAAGRKTLDYGCGSGCSTLFLKELSLDVEGVDISDEMLCEARQVDNSITYKLITSATLPYPENTFDIVFSSFVLFEISTKDELTKIANEIYRVLKHGGIFIAVTGSMELYKHDWLSLYVNYEQNRNLKSGDVAKLLLKDANLIVYDYFWTDNDYKEVFDHTPFILLEKLLPRGEEKDGYNWLDEKDFAPYVIYTLLKQ